MKDTTISVDTAKSVFEIAISDRPGHVRARYRLTRTAFLRFFAEREPVRVLLEACGSAHHWGRQLRALGHEVVLLPPHAVRPYVTRNKTDRSDARALLEASRNTDIHPVPVKSCSQQAITSLHRVRSGWLTTRTARLNAIRGLLREYGVAIPAGARQVIPSLARILDQADSPVPVALHHCLRSLAQDIEQLEERIHALELQLRHLSKELPVVGMLQTIPGVGPLSATALVAFVGDISRFPTGRHFASYLGLTPREDSSGLRRRLGAISKRGDAYLRMLLIHGARAVLWASRRRERTDRLRLWVQKLQSSRGHNKAAVALANKLSRIVWAVWKSGVEYQEVAAA